MQIILFLLADKDGIFLVFDPDIFVIMKCLG